METNRPSSAKWVSRRALDSQTHNRDHSAGMQHTRGHTPKGNMDNANTNNNTVDRRKYGSADAAVVNSCNVRAGGGNGGAYHTNSGNRFGASNSGSSASGTWSSITSSQGSNISKLNHHGMGYAPNALNSHSSHNTANHHHNGGRRVYGNGGNGSYGEAVEAAMPPPPRSVQMGQGTLLAHNAAAARDLIPQPRHAKGSHNIANNPPKSMDNSSSSGTPEATAAARRWASSTSMPTPRSAHNSNNPAVAGAATTGVHHDPHSNATVPRPSPALPFSTASNADTRVTPAPPLPPPPTDMAVFGGIGAAGTVPPLSHNSPSPSSGAAPPPPAPPGPSLLNSAAPNPRFYTGSGAVKPTLTSPVEALHLSEQLIFDARDIDEPAVIEPSEIEALLGRVERSTAAAANAPKEASMSGSLRERRSVADWGIEEAIKSVLPGMDEDDNSDDMQGPNVLSSGMAAISGNWHTSGAPDARQPVGVGLVADFPTSFAASFSEPVSAVLGSPFSGEPASNTMDNLSRVFSTAARADSSSFTSPATTSAATPLQRPPNTPQLHLPQYASPDDVVTMPPATAAALVPASTSLHKESAVVADDGIHGAADFLALFPQPPTADNSLWLSAGTGEIGATTTASRTSDTAAGINLSALKLANGVGVEKAAERPAETRAPPPAPSRASLLQSANVKDGSLDSNFCLTASTNANPPSVLPTRQPIITTSTPNSPSLRKEASTPLSASRSQTYATGGTRPQRPSLSAPLVNRNTITQIFRETPQSLLRKEKMVYNHEHSPQALCRDPHWPPRNNVEAEDMLRARGASKLQRHLTIICFSRQNVAGVQELFDTWAKNGIPAPDMGFGAYYYYVKEKSEKLLCMKHNGRGPSPGHGYGRCDFESRRPYSTCRYEHVCLFCRSKEHGWFEEGKCEGYQQLLGEMEKLGIVEDDVVTILNALEKNVKPAPLR